VDSNPDVNLVKPRFQAFLVRAEELAVLRRVFDVHKNPRELLLVERASMFPLAPNALGLPGRGAELFPQLAQRFNQNGVRDSPPNR
jgi:hypothetical protein